MENNKKLPKFLTTKAFQEHICPWSDDTIRRRIHEEGLPAQRDGKSFVFETERVIEWFKRRQLQTG